MGEFLELTITTDYVPNWGWWEILREFIQNTLDSHDAGFTMDIRRNPNGTVVLTNKGALLTRRTLLLGATSKMDGGSRGKFGEGYKLAMMAACRLALRNGSTEPPIRIKTGDEIWRPVIRFSNVYKADLLMVEINKGKSDGDLTVYIPNVPEEVWTQVESRVLALKGASKISLPSGEILLDVQRRSSLFVKGLWISTIPHTTYGYNLFDVEIDRDRRIAEYWSLNTQVTRVIEEALCMNKLSVAKVVDILNSNGMEAQALSNYSNNDSFHEKLCSKWNEENPESIPCRGVEDALVAESIGKKGVIVSEPLYKILSKKLNTLDKIKTENKFLTTKIYNREELPGTLLEFISIVMSAINNALGEQNDVMIVDFADKNILGVCTPNRATATNEIKIARSQCDDHEQFLDTLLHELGHRNGAADLKASHVNQITQDAAKIIRNLLHLD